MEERDNKQLLLNRIAELEKQLNVKHKKEQRFSEYVRESRFYANIPHDQFAHQTQIVRHPGRDPERRSELLDPDVVLSNIQDSRSLFLLQRDFLILHRFYDMGLRSTGLMMVWDSRYHPWVGQCRMTSAFKGGERRMQSFMEPTPTPGEGFTYLEKRKAKKEQKGWQRFLAPQNEGGVYE